MLVESLDIDSKTTMDDNRTLRARRTRRHWQKQTGAAPSNVNLGIGAADYMSSLHYTWQEILLLSAWVIITHEEFGQPLVMWYDIFDGFSPDMPHDTDYPYPIRIFAFF